MDPPDGDHQFYWLLSGLRDRYAKAIADGLLRRLRLAANLFHGAEDFLAAANLQLEDNALLDIVFSESAPQSVRATAAISVLGPHSIGRIIDTLLEEKAGILTAAGTRNPVAANRYHELLNSLAHAAGASLVTAILERSHTTDTNAMDTMAEVLWRHPTGESDRGRPFDAQALAAIVTLAQDWANKMLASDTATRAQLASIALLIKKSPSPVLLPMLKRLLDEELRQRREFRRQAEADHYRGGLATNEARMSWVGQYQSAFIAIGGAATAALVRAYLSDQDFGQCAAIVLAEQWRKENEPSDNSQIAFGMDFSYVGEKRAARVANPDTTSPEAEIIFGVIDTLISEGASNDQKRLGVALGAIALRLPHGIKDTTIQKLLALAQRRERAALALSLILSGEVIDISIVRSGIAEVFEDAKTQSWILSHAGYQLKEWLRLLPFTNCPTETFGIVCGLPAPQRSPEFLEELLDALRVAPTDEGENVAFDLAEADPRLYNNRTWQAAILRRGSASAAKRFIDLAVRGIFDHGMHAGWYLEQRLSNLIANDSQVRLYVYDLLKSGVTSRGLELLAKAVAESPDREGLLLLVGLEHKHGRSFVTWRTVEAVVTHHVPIENSPNAYNVVPISSAALRKALLAVAADFGSGSAAATCLSQIDGIRDACGAPESDPRHPDLASGRAWPMIS